MALIPFYKNANGEYQVGDYIVPAGGMIKSVNSNSGEIAIFVTGMHDIVRGATYAAFCGSNGVAYASLADFTTAGIGGFSGGASGEVPAKVIVELTRPSNIYAYTAGDCVNSSVASPVPLTVAGVASVAGGGGIALFVKAESNITAMAGATLRLWFFNTSPSGIVGDNVAHVNLYANSTARCFYVDVTFDALLAGSDSVFGQYTMSNEYMCAAGDNNLYMLIQTLTGFTPTSGGKIKFSLSVLKLA